MLMKKLSNETVPMAYPISVNIYHKAKRKILRGIAISHSDMATIISE
jgi:hypothetical protein